MFLHVKNMKYTSLTDYTVNSLRVLGVVLILTAALIWIGDPTQVVLFLSPYTGSRAILAICLIGVGITSTLISITLGRFSEKR